MQNDHDNDELMIHTTNKHPLKNSPSSQPSSSATDPEADPGAVVSKPQVDDDAADPNSHQTRIGGLLYPYPRSFA